MPFPPTDETVKTWKGFEDRLAGLNPKEQWIYRGVLSTWEPLTSLERVARAWKLNPALLPEVEFRLTRDFRRHPEGAEALGDLKNDILYVWALMQHHGAPTRLMDWTYSPYVAAFFAFDELLRRRSARKADKLNEPEVKPKDKPAVWALNTTWLNKKLKSHTSKATYAALCEKKPDVQKFERMLTRRRKRRSRFISTATPMVLNQRLSIQQGVFLFHGDITRSWRENLDALGRPDAPTISRTFVLDIDPDDAFRRLHRMNITARSLFPGLDGFGKFIFSRAKQLLDEPLQDR